MFQIGREDNQKNQRIKKSFGIEMRAERKKTKEKDEEAERDSKKKKVRKKTQCMNSAFGGSGFDSCHLMVIPVHPAQRWVQPPKKNKKEKEKNRQKIEKIQKNKIVVQEV